MQAKDYHGKSVIDSREVAEMVGKSHSHLLRDISGYIKIMEKANESNFGLVGNGLKIEPVDFFIPSTYVDGKGETRPCYLITKRGCDMIANKTTGEKGVLFTAAYVTAFEDMQKTLTVPQKRLNLPNGVSLSGLAKLITATKDVMLDMGSSATDIGSVVKGLYDVCCIPLDKAFSKQLPDQISFYDPPALNAKSEGVTT